MPGKLSAENATTGKKVFSETARVAPLNARVQNSLKVKT
jgi:hypothetical protein